MDLRHLLNVAAAALLGAMTEEGRVAWLGETEPTAGASRERVPERKPESRGVRALMAVAASMPRS